VQLLPFPGIVDGPSTATTLAPLRGIARCGGIRPSARAACTHCRREKKRASAQSLKTPRVHADEKHTHATHPERRLYSSKPVRPLPAGKWSAVASNNFW
jgi:hypothetical protein